MIKLTLSGSIRTKKTGQQPTPIPSKGKTTIMKFYKRKGWTPVRIIILPGQPYRKWEAMARSEALTQVRKQGLYIPLRCKVAVKALFYYKGVKPDLS